jgi:CRP/FNR family transcriptional regulator
MCPPFLPGAWARSPGRVLLLGLESVRPLLWRHPSFARALAELAQERWEETAARLADLLLGSLSVRVRSVLVRLAEASGVAHKEGTLISLPVTQGDIAAMVGASRESVNRALADLAASGEVCVVDRRHLVIRGRRTRLEASA